MCILVDNALCPIVQVISEDAKEYETHHQPFGYITSYWSVTGLSATDHNILTTTDEPVFNLPYCSLT